MNKTAVFILMMIAGSASMAWADELQRDYVPDKDTAIKIAVAVWEPIYGKELIATEKPYVAELQGDVWYVHGTLGKEWARGGTAQAKIAKKDGRLIEVTHYK